MDFMRLDTLVQRRARGLAALALLLSPTFAGAQSVADLAGTWRGEIQIPGSPLGVVVKLSAGSDGAFAGTIDIPQQGATALPLTNMTQNGASVGFTISGIPGNPTFSGTVGDGGSAITGTFTQGGASFPFALKRGATVPAQGSALLDSVRGVINGAMKEWNVPGLSVAVVLDGEVILSEGFGYRDLDNKLPVTPSTLFAIGSSTKAFTSLIIGSLVDEGKLDWDKPVVAYLPDFKLKDPYATAQLRVRDLLTHVSGLPRHDLMWYGSTFTRKELFDHLQYLESSAPLRTTWQYQNLMYMTAGYLAEQVSGRTWEQLVHERIFEPLGMSSSNFSVDSLRMTPDHALPYEERQKKVVMVPYRNIDQIGPAGSINSNAIDMARWVRLHLGDGTFEGKKVVEPSALRMVHAPQVVMDGSIEGDEKLFNLYAMGWMVHAYRGRVMLEHGGNIDGFTAMVSFMPKEKIGMAILSNLDGSVFPTLVRNTIYDILLGSERKDWSAYGKSMMLGIDSATASMKEMTGATRDIGRVSGTSPSHPLRDYAGEFESPGYGVMTVEQDGKKLKATFNGISSTLEHFHYDVFTLGGANNPLDGMKLQFATNLRGDIESLAAKLEPSVEPIVFTRRASSALSDTSYLAQFAGSYLLSGAGATATVALEGRGLTLTIPGQPVYRLVPYKELEFTIADLKGFSLKFNRQAGKIDEVAFIQPNGTFLARRK